MSISLRGSRAATREKVAINTFIDNIRSVSYFKDVPIIAMIECAPGIAASHIETYLRKRRLVFVMKERASGSAEGVPKTEEITRQYVLGLMVAINSDKIRFTDKLITNYEDPYAALKKLQIQLQNLRVCVATEGNEIKDTKFVIRGKTGTTPDDIAVALMMIIYWMNRFWSAQRKDYKEMRRLIMNMTKNSK